MSLPVRRDAVTQHWSFIVDSVFTGTVQFAVSHVPAHLTTNQNICGVYVHVHICICVWLGGWHIDNVYMSNIAEPLSLSHQLW